MFSQMPPAGNKIKLTATKFDSNFLPPFKFKGYQTGTAALAAALTCLKKISGISQPQAILPAYACPDVISACLFAKVQPVLVDLEKERPWMDLQQVSKNINPDTLAIIAINFLGIPERLDKLRQITNERDLPIIEDSAQGFAKEKSDNYWHGDMIITSFGRGKPVSLLAGGGIFYREKKYTQFLPEPIKDKTNSIAKYIYLHKIRLYNKLLNPAAYFIASRLPFLSLGETRFKPLNAIRDFPLTAKKILKVNYESYQQRSQQTVNIHNILEQTKSKYLIDLPYACKLPENTPLLRYPILITDKDRYNIIAQKSDQQGIGVSKMYQRILPLIPGINQSIFASHENFQCAASFASQLITLPTHEQICEKNIEKIERIFQQVL